ncbi:MAG: hypothetical protein GY733_05100 [bacterium]|nr:hypothetical protein [bacterium]
MVSGVNTNIRYRGVLFHVQSESSGVSTPRILTHLFKGGDILASTKGDYSDKLDSENLDGEVRAMMEEQHKSMLRALTRGEHDEAIIARLGPDALAGEKGPDTDVTIPPPELADAVEGVVAAPAEPVTADGVEQVSAKERLTSAFGNGVVSEKPLDEVVLDFLVDNARKRKRQQK